MSTTDAHWTARPERGSLLAMHVMLKLSLWFGRKLTRPILWGITLYFFATAPAARRASRDYLARVLPHPVRWYHVMRHFLTFSIVVQDRVYFLKDRHAVFDLQVYGTEELHAVHAQQGGLLLFGAHLGSFEASRSIARNNTRPVAIAMYEQNAVRTQRTLASINAEAAAEILPLGRVDSMLAIHDKLAARYFVGVLADRNFGNDTQIPTSVLDAPAGLPDGPFRLAASLRVPVFFMTGLYLGGNRYDIHVERIADFSDCPRSERNARMHAAREAYAARLSRYCRKAPYNWFNFFDFWNLETVAGSDRQLPSAKE